MYFFADFVLDPDRAELRNGNGSVMRLRPKTLELFKLLVANSQRVLGKEELMEAVWPGIHVGDDSLFQCIREIRAAIGDSKRQMVQAVSGRGYLFALDVSTAKDMRETPEAPQQRSGGKMRKKAFLAAGLAGLLLIAVGLAAVVFNVNRIFQPARPVLELLPIVETDVGTESAAIARGIVNELVSGFSSIDGIELILHEAGATPQLQNPATLQIHGELKRNPQAWVLEARLVDVASREIRAVASVTVDSGETDRQRLASRLAAGIGYPLAARLSALQDPEGRRNETADIAIRQAIASINQTTRERFGTAQNILEKYLSADPDNVDLQIALAGLHLRAMQMNWYTPAESIAAQNDARTLLETALTARPRSMPVLDAYCRFLTVSNQFAESLVACARALTVNPWDGTALYNLGLTQIQLGRFADALAATSEAERFDTPEVSRWTWLLGAGWANLLLGNDEEAVALLQRSIAITPGSGRPYLLLAAAQQRLGHTKQAKDALAMALELRPHSTARNVALPTRNASKTFLAASNAIIRTLIEIGLPTGLPR